MTLDSWMIANIGLNLKEIGAFLGLLGSVTVNVYLIRDRLAARTLALKDATIKQLEVSLAISVCEAKKKTNEHKEAENEIANCRSLLVSSQDDNRILHDEISVLENRIAAMSSGGSMFVPKQWDANL